MSISVEPSSSLRRFCRRLDLARMRAQRVHFVAKRAAAAGECVERHRGGEIGGFEQRFEAIERKHGAREHLRRAVVEREAFLERKAHRREASALERFGAGDMRSPL